MVRQVVNGRVSQRELYDAIGSLRIEQQEGFREVKSDIRDLAERVRGVELQQIKDEATDAGRDELLSEQREIKEQQGVSKRWLISLAVGMATSITLSVLGLAVGVAERATL